MLERVAEHVGDVEVCAVFAQYQYKVSHDVPHKIVAFSHGLHKFVDGQVVKLLPWAGPQVTGVDASVDDIFAMNIHPKIIIATQDLPKRENNEFMCGSGDDKKW